MLASPGEDTHMASESFRRPSVDSIPALKLQFAQIQGKLPLTGESLDTDIDSKQLAVPISKGISKPKATLSQDRSYSGSQKGHMIQLNSLKKSKQGSTQFPVKKEKAKIMRNAIHCFRRKMSFNHKHYNKVNLTKKVLEAVKRSKIVSTELNYRVILLNCNLEKIDKALERI